jgi:hypothetical protein
VGAPATRGVKGHSPGVDAGSLWSLKSCRWLALEKLRLLMREQGEVGGLGADMG